MKLKKIKLGFSNKEILSVVGSGLLLGISFPPFRLPYFLFAALVPYLLVIRKKSKLAEINRLTYLNFFVFSLITLYWVSSWMPEADPFLIASGVALIFFNPLVFMIPSTLYYFSKKYINESIAFWSYPFFFVTYEYLYSVTEFRFPWLTLGNGLAYFKNYIQIADIIGVYGLSLLVLFANAALTAIIKNYIEKELLNKKLFLFLLLIIILPIIYGNVKLKERNNSGEDITVGLIQPNFDPWKKWNYGSAKEQLDIYLRLSGSAVKKGAELIIWPETALPVYLLSGSYAVLVNKIRRFVDSENVSLITGMPHIKMFKGKKSAPVDARRSQFGDYYYASYNAVLAFLPHKRKIQEYGKIKLVPFGEKVPYVEYFPFIGKLIKWNVGISSWSTGRDTTVFELEGLRDGKNVIIRSAPIICIESIYSDFVAQFVKKGAELITVVTNDSWYGNSSGPYQHQAISFLRAVENRRFVVRAANGGISCIIDQYGEPLVASKMYERTIIVGKVKLLKGKTFFTSHPLLIPRGTLFITLAFVIFIFIKNIFNRVKRNGKNN